MVGDLLSLNKELFDILEESLEGSFIFMCDMRSGHMRWSKSAIEYFNMGSNVDLDLNTGTIPWLKYIHPEDRHIFLESYDKMINGETDKHHCEYRAINRYGVYIWLLCKGTVLRDEAGTPVFFAGAMTNLGHSGKYDGTTNLKNIYEFRSDLFKWLCSNLEKKRKAGIMMFGIDNFGQINEKYAYTFGNKVLRQFGKKLHEKKSLGMEFYRMEGVKFVCFYPDASQEDLSGVFQVIQDIAQHSILVDGKQISLTVSGGAMFYPQDGGDVETIHRNLEYVLQFAKHSNGCEQSGLKFFTSEILDASLREADKLEDLRDSVRDNCRGFYLCYQPIVRTYSDALYSCEALVRWKDKNGRNVSPMEFIPLLESTGDIVEAGNWILESGLAQLSEWHKKLPELKININVSYLQFEDDRFIPFVLQKLEEYKVPAETLVLELTETCKVSDVERLREKFAYLRSMGIRIALDDFGTGYASVSSLKDLPIDSVKIDHGFVSQLTKRQSDRYILEYLINLSQKLGLEVCVEGIETAAIRNLVQAYMPDSLQGYYFSHPLEAEEFYVHFIN